MFKKLGLSAIALAAMMMLAAPPQANAKVRFGIAIGGPAYTYPVDPYVSPYAYGYNYPYAYPNVYPYGSPGYVAPYYSYGWGGHDWDRRGWGEHEGYRFRGHEGHDRGHFGGSHDHHR